MSGEIDFLILGGEKCGTTWLAGQLRRHPQVFIPAGKELFYFNAQFFESPELPNYNATQPLSWYLAHFQAASPGQIKGEASPAYLWDPAAPERIHDFDPSLRLIAVLRQPVERAFSQYLYYMQRGVLAGISFEEATDRRPDLITRGLYAQQLQRYYDRFPRDRIYVAFYDDLKADGSRFLTGIEAFLGVPEFLPEGLSQPVNVTGVPRFPWLNRLLAWMRYPIRRYNPPWLIGFLRRTGLAALQEKIRLANTRPFEERPTVPQPVFDRLMMDVFQEDVETLQQMTGRDLQAWFTPRGQAPHP